MSDSEEDANIRIDKFKLEWMPWASTIVLLGMRKRGKTFFMKELIHHFNADLNIVFAGSDGSYDEFIGITNPLFVFDAFTDISVVDEKLTLFMELMMDKDQPRPKKILVLIDDLGMEDEVTKSQVVLDFFSRGRHLNKFNGVKYGITVIISIQYAKMIGPAIRSNLDFLFCFQLNNNECYRQVQTCYTTLNTKEFNSLMRTLHEEKEYASLVINNEPGAAKRKQAITWYKARERRKKGFVGSSAVNDLADWFYDPERFHKVKPVVRTQKQKKGKQKKGRAKKEPAYEFNNSD
jgi:hypothetical protein